MASKKIDDLKKRANKRRMLEAQMKGLREEGKHWSGYIKKNERKAKATKAIKTAAEIAELAGGAGAVVKSVGKQVAKKASRVAMNKGSKFAKRSTRATQAQTAKKVVSKKGTTRGKATAKDILGGNPVRKKAVSKAAPKKSAMPQSMSKNKNAPGSKGKRDRLNTAQKEGGYVDRNKASVKVAQNRGETFAKDTGTKPYSSAYRRAVNEVLHNTNKGKSYESATKAVRAKQPLSKHKAAVAKGNRARIDRKLKEESARVRAAKTKAKKKKK